MRNISEFVVSLERSTEDLNDGNVLLAAGALPFWKEGLEENSVGSMGISVLVLVRIGCGAVCLLLLEGACSNVGTIELVGGVDVSFGVRDDVEGICNGSISWCNIGVARGEVTSIAPLLTMVVFEFESLLSSIDDGDVSLVISEVSEPATLNEFGVDGAFMHG
jgi:hypothetical protein